jgi:hypothetical protein
MDADNESVTKELAGTPHVLEDKHGDMDAIYTITECLARYDNLPNNVREEYYNALGSGAEEEDPVSLEDKDPTAKIMEDLPEHAKILLFQGPAQIAW